METKGKSIIEPDNNKKMHFDAIIAEYSTLRNEIISIQGEIHQLSLSAFASVAGLAAFIGTLIKPYPAVLASVLLFLPFLFAAMVLSYLGHLAALTNISTYIFNHIEPNINKVISTDALGWFKFQHDEMSVSTGWYAQGLWALGQGILILLPFIASLLGFYFTLVYSQLAFNTWWKIMLSIDIILGLFICVFIVITISRYNPLRFKKGQKS